MIEALYKKNRVYLSLNSANLFDFQAIMQDHYNCVDDREQCEKINFLENSPAPFTLSDSEEQLPKKRKFRPFDLTRPVVVPKKISRRLDAFELTSRISPGLPLGRNRKKGKGPLNSFTGLVYTADIYLKDFVVSGFDEPISTKVLKWANCEWFYSYIDRGYFQYSSLQEALQSIGFAEKELTFSEWRSIKRGIGRPRRFSQKFVESERGLLHKYREGAKLLQQGKVLTNAYSDILPYLELIQDPPLRLAVGQKVLAIHPTLHAVNSGSILTLDNNYYHIQFDNPQLGVCQIADVQILPISMPEEQTDSNSPYQYNHAYLTEKEFQMLEGNFKEGVNIKAMSLILNLLERKEKLLEELRTINFKVESDMTVEQELDVGLKEQCRWLVRFTQVNALVVVNHAIGHCLKILRLRTQPILETQIRSFNTTPYKSQSRQQVEDKLDAFRNVAETFVQEKQHELLQTQLTGSEFHKLQDQVTSSITLLMAIDDFKTSGDQISFKCARMTLQSLRPTCEANWDKYNELVELINELGSSFQIKI